jgi:hypothetical protein
VCVLVCLAAAAHAQITDEPAPAFPDPAKFAHGIYADGEIGAVTPLGKAGDKVSPGIAIGARMGWDIFRWVAVQAHVLGSTHEASFDNMPQSGQLLQLYQMLGELKLTYTFRRLSLYASGGAGLVKQSSNLLATAGLLRDASTLYDVSYGGGGGFDWHTLNRHFSVGLYGGFYLLSNIRSSGTLPITTYLRYTF